MPFVFNFDNCIEPPQKVTVNPTGWKNPITVEYGVAQAHKFDTMRSVVWRIAGTTHTFTIYEHTINIASHGNYAKHFEEILTNFRIDYLHWFKDEEYENASCKYEYQQQFGNLILPDKDNESED